MAQTLIAGHSLARPGELEVIYRSAVPGIRSVRWSSAVSNESKDLARALRTPASVLCL